MAFTSNDINAYYPVDRVNGGRIGFTQIVSGQSGNVFPLALPSDLSTGRTLLRKIGFRIDDLNNRSGLEAFVRIWKRLASDAYRCWFPVSSSWVLGDLTGTEEKYGTATLKYAVASADTTMVVTVKHASHATGNDAIFNAGKLCSICAADQGATVDVGLQNYVVVSGAPSVSGLDVTLTLSDPVGNDYAAGALVQSFPDKVDVETSYSNVDKTAIGTTTFDEAQLVLDNVGTPALSVTITMTGATTFTSSGDWEGIVSEGESSLGEGSVSSDFSPLNRFNARPIFTIPSGAIAGSPVSGDSFSFDITGADYPMVVKHVIPASTSSISGDVDDVFFQTASAA